MKNKSELEKSILIAMNGLLLQMLNGDISFDDAEDLLFLPKNLTYIKNLNFNKEIIELFEECLQIDALFLFDIFPKEGLDLQKRIQKLLQDYKNIRLEQSLSLRNMFTQ